RSARILFRAVVDPEHDDALRRGPQPGWRRSLRGARGEPAHVAVVAGGEIGREVLPRPFGERGTGEADGVEAERERLFPDGLPEIHGFEYGPGRGSAHERSHAPGRLN